MIQEIKPKISFGRIYKLTKPTSYGKRLIGSSRGYDYDVYVKENEVSHQIEHKLYCVWRDSKWVKSFLRYFNNNKLIKEIRSSKK